MSDAWLEIQHEILAQEVDLEMSDRRTERLRPEPKRPRNYHRTVRSQRLAKARQMGWHTDWQWLSLVKICGDKCVRCGMPGRVEKDHIVPLYQGGCDCIGNLQPLCPRCNCSKGPESLDFRPPHWSAALAR